ncbi:MAG: nitrite reductase (NAD(P)H) small subunit [Melioribacteraceae bacterium]|nr:nitrite reductase (NAD(P)H) small subunit [Melioribacteraceae bacterium]MCF8265998.1 nitrite reductase (NAD(P)H) small subunit [Melioribacteraceae bacterium]MCF8414176.1 nitrite reductase (NAD(P)H) small subunit [Melioribacteraceae bacterium]
MDDFFKVCKLSDLREGCGNKYFIDEVEIALFLVNGEVFALNNVCPHQHAGIIYDGFIENGCVICPAHGWTFQLKNGNRKDGRKGLDSYEVKIQDEYVYVKVFKKELNW